MIDTGLLSLGDFQSTVHLSIPENPVNQIGFIFFKYNLRAGEPF